MTVKTGFFCFALSGLARCAGALSGTLLVAGALGTPVFASESLSGGEAYLIETILTPALKKEIDGVRFAPKELQTSKVYVKKLDETAIQFRDLYQSSLRVIPKPFRAELGDACSEFSNKWISRIDCYRNTLQAGFEKISQFEEIRQDVGSSKSSQATLPESLLTHAAEESVAIFDSIEFICKERKTQKSCFWKAVYQVKQRYATSFTLMQDAYERAIVFSSLYFECVNRFGTNGCGVVNVWTTKLVPVDDDAVKEVPLDVIKAPKKVAKKKVILKPILKAEPIAAKKDPTPDAPPSPSASPSPSVEPSPDPSPDPSPSPAPAQPETPDPAKETPKETPKEAPKDPGVYRNWIRGLPKTDATTDDVKTKLDCSSDELLTRATQAATESPERWVRISGQVILYACHVHERFPEEKVPGFLVDLGLRASSLMRYSAKDIQEQALVSKIADIWIGAADTLLADENTPSKQELIKLKASLVEVKDQNLYVLGALALASLPPDGKTKLQRVFCPWYLGIKAKNADWVQGFPRDLIDCE